ncbi:MAG: hypothetical protein JNK48_15710 [Bryobacterales bacterium]|nr:hypothetical protein [Bryobacterales bacterium]
MAPLPSTTLVTLEVTPPAPNPVGVTPVVAPEITTPATAHGIDISTNVNNCFFKKASLQNARFTWGASSENP